jgi:hypothetical protein
MVANSDAVTGIRSWNRHLGGDRVYDSDRSNP